VELDDGEVTGAVIADDRGRVVRPLPISVTEMLVAPSTTWLLVSTSPEEVSTWPVPAADSP